MINDDDTRLDAELLPVIQGQRVRYADRPPMGSLPPAEMRQRASDEFVEWNAGGLPIEKVVDLAIPASPRGAEIPLRLYDPAPDQLGGCLVYFHGGGWIVGDLELEDAGLRRIAHTGGFKVLSVDYRLAPEHPFPAAIEDGESVIGWLAQYGATLNIDAARLALGGASAGANVALGTALRIRDNKGPELRFLALLYGAFGGGATMASHAEFGDGRFGLPLIAMDAFWQAYLGERRDHPHAVPLIADLAELPSAYIAKAELDVLADESEALAGRMREAGVAVECRTFHGAMHGFTQYAKVSALGRAALDDAARALAEGLS